jgi:glycosyltransferase involved in cell wall biosynthesis
MNQFDLVITTYNRPQQVVELARQALGCTPAPTNLFIVDSSDKENKPVQELPAVVYVRSSHKNQPYQRLLGAKAATAEIIVFMDDDLAIVSKDIFQHLVAAFDDPNRVGAAVAFEYLQPAKHQMNLPILATPKSWKQLFWQFTGVPFPTSGKMARLGVSGEKPTRPSEVQSFNGANMAFRRDIALKIVPDDLLSQVERRLSMGEDKVISMSALQYGRLQYIPEVCLLHPPNESTYFQNIRSFTAKVAYSRLYLSRIYARVFHKSLWREVLIYYWFTAWRVLIALFSLLIRPSKGRKDKLLGALDGLWLALTLPQKAERLTPGINWPAEIQKDLANARRATSRN